MQEQTQLVFYNRSAEEVKNSDYPAFNGGNHYLVDMSHLDPRTEDWMNTISIKLPNDNFITVCVMQTSKDESCIDTQFHGDNIKEHRVLGLGGGTETSIYNKNIYALIATAKEVK